MKARSWAVAMVSVLGLLGLAHAPWVRAADPPTGPRPEDGTPAPAGANDWTCRPTPTHPRPVVLVHGLGSTMAENWGYLSPILKARGWCVFALTYGERPQFPQLGGVLPMEESSHELDSFVHRVLAATGAAKVDLVGHSEGTVMPQYWLKRLGGAAVTERYVALTPLYDGTTAVALAPAVKGVTAASPAPGAAEFFDRFCGSCREFLKGSDFLTALYADGTAAPGVTYTTIMTRLDEVVVPYRSGELHDGQATNIVLQDLCPLDLSEHAAVAIDPVVARLVLNGLDPEQAMPPTCGGVLGLGFGPVRP